MLMNFLLLIAGFIILIFSADKLVDGSSSLARKFGIPDIVIGLTIVAFGTSAPELFVNVIAAINGNTQLVLGNIIGSNIFNVLVILGVSSLIYPLSVKRNTTWLEIPLSLLAGLVVLFMSNDVFFDKAETNILSRIDGIILFCFFIIFHVYSMEVAKSGVSDEEFEAKDLTKLKSTIFILVGLAGLVIGGELIVNSAVNIANNIGISERMIALTIVSIGTSLPELATSIVAVKKKNVDIALGNIVGSNIYNIFFILGISAFISPVNVEKSNSTEIWINIFANILLFIFIFSGKGRRIERWEGMTFLFLYLAYILVLILGVEL
ncbi:MAG TPA: calcium/sodium antiporter [Ignavibacteria bacterium]|nr:calcium/sodium antiporter [Ignavibacteria bacterium]HRJ99454.1 calcium/sodium antiporter [Ignavibacteria bacterium]